MNTQRRLGLPPGAMVGLARWLPSGDGLTRLLTLLLTLAAGWLLWLAVTTRTPVESPPTRLSLVLEDAWPQDDMRVQAWRDAADELGFVLDVVTASQLMRQGATQRDAALILPDAMHRHINEPLLAHLRARVEDGARLMLVHDAGHTDMKGQPQPGSRWAGLVGVRYGLAAEATGSAAKPAAAATPHAQTLWVPPAALDALSLAPGLLLRQASKIPLTTPQTTPQMTERLWLVAAPSLRNTALPSPSLPLPPLPLPFITEGRLDGQLLLGGAGDQVLAASHTAGRGTVLFVNLPLTAMKLQGDGLLLHSLLRHFAQDIAQLPQLSPLPDARGALVMNWHIDNAAALPALAQLAKLGLQDLGPYAVHLANDISLTSPAGDQGLADWLRKWSQREDEIGSHDLSLSPATLEAGLKAVRSATGRPVREHSSHAAAQGEPAWLAPALAKQGVSAYRTVADVGAAATRSYVQGQRGPADLWAFPALGYGGAASLEQARAGDAAESEVGAWLDDVMSYCAEQRVLRTLDFHPPAAMLFPQAFEPWFEHVSALVKSDRLRLTTPSSHAAFANRRLTVQWQVSFEQGRLRLQAKHATSLAHMSWLLPAQGFEAPQMQEGAARVERVGPYWRVTADGVKQLVVTSAAMQSDTR
jgi:hypothetical protein